MAAATFSQYAAERKFADTIKDIYRKEKATRKHLRLPYVAAKRRFEQKLVDQGYEYQSAWEIANGAIQMAELEFACEQEA